MPAKKTCTKNGCETVNPYQAIGNQQAADTPSTASQEFAPKKLPEEPTFDRNKLR
jgi:hypothetical protein